MKEKRRQRISSFLRAQLAEIIARELKDPRLGFISVTRVEPAEDLREAKVYISVMGTEAEQRTSMRGIEAASGKIQSLLGDRIHFRNTPELRFIQDDSIRKSMEMDSLLERARQEDQAAAEERASRTQSDGDVEDA